jgi:hypothetical protein
VQAHTEQVQFARQQREIARLRAELAEAKRALPVEREYDAVLARLHHIPDGCVPVAAFTDGREIIVVGDPTCELHDCDVMGCGVDHVLVRVTHPFALVANDD